MSIFERAVKATELVDRIADPSSDFFDAADARELIDLIPVQKWQMPEIFFMPRNKKPPTKKVTAYVAGVGNVDYEEKKQSKNITIGGEDYQRIGQYKFYHTKGKMEIRVLFGETYADVTGTRLRLIYNARSKEPISLLSIKRKPLFTLPSFNRGYKLRISKRFYMEWKTPAPNA